MGNLRIKQVKYSGEKYFFESPLFTDGINIIEGDNGSGKSTLSYFIEFGLGGEITVFNANNKHEKYKKIINDKNNFVELTILINDIEYKLKRFIGKNDIFLELKDGKIKKFCIKRLHCAETVFSDWLLDKLDIKRFELSLGEINWFFSFNDLFRLLNYDQNTEPRKIFKTPNNDNFVTDSAIIRKSIFETLMGTSSDEYFLKMNELNEAKLQKKEAQFSLDEFNKLNPNLNSSLKDVEIEETSLLQQMEKLVKNRNDYQKEHTHIGDKFKDIEDTKAKLIKLEIDNSQKKIYKKNLQIERDSIQRLLSIQENEIDSINKSIFTNDKLNLFDFEYCPFCASSIEKEAKKCLCGSTIVETNYEKFLYNSNEYQEILKHKYKSLESTKLSLTSYDTQIEALAEDIDKIDKQILELTSMIKSAIESIEYSGNTQLIDRINAEISKVKENIFKSQQLINLYREKEKREVKFNSTDTSYKSIFKSFNLLKSKYNENNAKMTENFNSIYNKLMQLSSAKAQIAVIDEDYVPYVDGGDYREKSASVPRRMMYYFTLLAMGLKYKNIKHPHFLLMDTPEEAGIDDITENIILLDKALELSKNSPTDNIGNYQFILTTAINKYPDKYKEFVKLKFNKKEKNFILTEK
ncbi:MAG: AAA family ATPase [Pseudomonadota bacterium]